MCRIPKANWRWTNCGTSLQTSRSTDVAWLWGRRNKTTTRRTDGSAKRGSRGANCSRARQKLRPKAARIPYHRRRARSRNLCPPQNQKGGNARSPLPVGRVEKSDGRTRAARKNFGSACFKLLQIRMEMPMLLMILMLMLPLPLPPPLPPPLLPPLPFYFTIVSITRITTS